MWTNWLTNDGANWYFWLLPLNPDDPYMLGIGAVTPPNGSFPGNYFVEPDEPV